MKLAGIRSQGVRGLPDLDIRFNGAERAPAKIVAITGGPGAGKTRLLDAIATAKECAAAYGPRPSSNGWQRNGLSTAQIDIDWWLTSAEQREVGLDGPLATSEVTLPRDGLASAKLDPGLAFLLGRYAHDAEVGKVDWFRSDRMIPSGGGLPSDIVFEQKTRRLARDNGKYAGLPGFIGRAIATGARHGREFSDLFARLCPRRQVVGNLPDGRPGFSGDDGIIGIGELADSEKMAFMFAAAMVTIGLHESVVLVDGPELFQAPGEGARMLAELSAHAPTTQWLVATNDREVVSMAEAVVSVGGER
jgi:hypothetical protein